MKAASMIKAKPVLEKAAPKEPKEKSKTSEEAAISSKLAYKDPLIEKEDAEIARLGKLLGLNKG